MNGVDQATILAVDDTVESLDLLISILTLAGYQVRPASSGELALAAVAADPPDLILLDMRMPGVDGMEVCRQIKAGEATQHIPILLISAFSDVKDRITGMQLGAADYITKPFHPEELLMRIKTHLALSRANISLAQQAAELRPINEQLQAEMGERKRVEDKLRQNLERAERSRRALLSTLEDQKQSEEALRVSEARFRSIFERSTVGKSLTLPDGRLMKVNQALADMLGYSVEELQSLNFAHVTVPEDIPATREVIRGLLANERDRYRLEKRYFHKNGAIIWADVSTTLLRDANGTPLYLITSIVDITEKKRAQAQIQHLASFPQVNRNPVLELDSSGMVIYANPAVSAALERLGYPADVHVLIPSDIGFILSELEQGKDTTCFREVALGSAIFREDIFLFPKFHSVRIYALDVTGQKQAEARIKKLNRIYAVLSNINQAIVRTRDLNSLFEQVCQIAVTVGEFRMAWIGLLDESPQQIRVVAHSGGSDAYFSQVASTLRNETVKTCAILNALRGNQHTTCNSVENESTPAPCQELAIKLGCRSSAAFPLSVSGKIRGTANFYASEADFFDEDEIRLLTELALDISFAIEFAEKEEERKQVEERLAHERTLLRTLIDNLPDSIYTKDLAGRKLLANRADLALTGAATEAEVLGKTDTELYPADVAAAFMADDRDVFENRKMIINREELVLDNFGHQKWLLTSKLPLQNPDGQVVGLIGIGRDISERKQAEEQILQLNAELEQRVRERTAQLESANKEMEAFTYSVSHDLRSPLRGIDGWSHILLEENYDQLNEQGRESLNFICSETKRMGLLIENLLHLSRVIHAEMQREPVDLSTLAEEVINRLQKEQPRSDVEVIIQPALTARGDGELLEIVLTNLLNNAWKYTGARSNARIEMGQTEVHGQPAFFVRDNGVGFDMAYAQKLFGVFQRMHRVTEFPGTGIGLAIVQRIIHRHGGEVWAEAQVNQGATFYFTLEKVG